MKMKKEKKEYQRPSITVIEADLQQPIATSASASDSVQAGPWGEDPSGDGIVNDD
jgi:hypothetical protein